MGGIIQFLSLIKEKTMFLNVLMLFSSNRKLKEYKENVTGVISILQRSCHVPETWGIIIYLHVLFSFVLSAFMVSALVSGSSGPGSSPGRGHCLVFLSKTLYSHSASLHPGV